MCAGCNRPYFPSTGPGKSQSMGNPAVLQQRMWSLGVAAEFSRYEMEGHEYDIITRGLTKVDFSVYKNVYFALLLDMDTMDIMYPENKQLTDFNGSNSFAVGGSLKLISDVPGLPMLKLFGEGGLRQSPVGDVSSNSTTDPGDFHLPQQFVVNIHFRAGNGSAASIGISQSGLLSR